MKLNRKVVLSGKITQDRLLNHLKSDLSAVLEMFYTEEVCKVFSSLMYVQHEKLL